MRDYRNVDNRFSLIIIFLMVTIFLLFLLYLVNPALPRRSLTQFLADVEAGSVELIRLRPTGQALVQLKDGTRYETHILTTDAIVQQLLQRRDLRIFVEGASWFGGMGSFQALLLILGITFIFWLLFFRQNPNPNQQAFAFSKSRARVLIDNKPKVTFKDVAGLEEAKEELQEVIDFLRNPAKYQRLGARIPKGVLLVGPPGTGKTLLARAVAGEANVPFINISGSEFVELFVGVGAARVRDLFQTAHQHAPCVLFIDEIDAVGRQRGAGLGGGHDEREQTLNQLLVEMDGFDVNQGLVVLAATNRPDILDPALLRPGRFDRRIIVDRPDQKERLAILRVHTRRIPLDHDVDLEEIARRTPGFTGADLANLCNEAAILAARQNLQRVPQRLFLEAIERVISGPQKKSRILSEKERRLVAYHETGHALLGWLLPDADPVYKISILTRGIGLGYTLQLPEEDRHVMTKREILDRLTVLLGGRAAEEIVFQEVSTGAENDLQQLTDLARQMVKDFGMSETLGPMKFGKDHGGIFLGRDIVSERDYSEETARLIDHEVRRIVNYVHQRALNLLQEYRWALDRIAEELLKREILERKDFEELMEELGLPRGAAPRAEWPPATSALRA